ncbi:MAG: efflux RND transporter periplasmic adaptor subunit [Chthonomonadaceae bacterium]|nr:efflux RND transporter periplasmic adaptor subunit [Chthonomonadaceae bacterium]
MNRVISLSKILLLSLLASLAVLALASLEGEAGSYRIHLSTQPAVVPVGPAKLTLEITDPAGKPLDDLDVRVLASMPGMFMGEREQRAAPVPGRPGGYSMQAAFPMAGGYEVTVRIAGDQGSATTVIPLQTGQDTASQGGFTVLPWLLCLAVVVFVVARMRRAGERMNVRAAMNRGTIGGLTLLLVLLFGAVYAVNNLRRQGAMTPLEAQVMDMSTPAPPGMTAVRLGDVTRGPLAETVTYTGQAVGYVEQDVNARVGGVIVWMPFYVGDAVKKDQVLARLDTSQLDPQLAERAAMADVATQGVGVAANTYETTLQQVAEARAELGAREGKVDEAEAMLEAARADRGAAEAGLAVAESEVPSAVAEVDSATERARFRAEELRRDRELFAKGAISPSELQQSESENADAQAKLQQAQSMVRQTKAKVAAACSMVTRADSMIVAAQRRVAQTKADVRAAQASIRARESAAAAAKQSIAKERAGVAQARASYNGAAAQRGYSEIRAEVDGVITQRVISPGVLVAPGQSVLKVAQVSPIRLQANVAMEDIDRISVGDPVTVRDPEGKGVPIRSQVRSVAPALDPRSRTGVVEVVWPNADGRFSPGQFVEMQIEVGRVADALTVPAEAVQHGAGEPGLPESFVWVAEPGDDTGRFTVKRIEVELGRSDGQRREVTGALEPGQKVVTQGAAYLREGGEVMTPLPKIESKGPVVEVTTSGYKPSTVTVELGKPVTITFIRRTDQTCGSEILFPDLGINKPLPLNEPVEVTFTPTKGGDLRFTCAMDMLRGKVVVR